MKKIVSILLCIILCFSLTCCGKETAGSSEPASSVAASSTPSTETEYVEVELTYTDIKAGYIVHTTAAQSSVTEAEGYECMDDCYAYLPEDTVISCDKEMAFFTYVDDTSGSNGTVLNTFVMSGSGLTVDGMTPTFSAGSFTLSKSCLVRFAVKGSLSDIKISVPAGSELSVMVGSKNDMSAVGKVETLNEFIYSKGQSVNYIFISDLHNGSYVNDPDGDGLRNYDDLEDSDARLESRRNKLAQAVAAANMSPYIDFIVVAGDIINGYETPESLTYQRAQKSDSGLTVREHVIDQLQEMLAPLKNCKKPVFVLKGNHDNNNGHSLWMTTNHPGEPSKLAEYMISDLDWEREIFDEFVNVEVVRDQSYSYGGESIAQYYYYDLEKFDRTTRIILLDGSDSRLPFNSSGAVTNSAGGNLVYTSEQVKWVAETALMGDFDNCIIISHTGYTTGSTQLEKLFKAYQLRTNYIDSANGINANYSSRTSGDILSYQHGHDHEDLNTYSSSLKFWTISSANMSVDIAVVTEGSVYKYYFDSGKSTELTRTGTAQ